MITWVSIMAFCLMDYQGHINCAAVLYSTYNYKTEKECIKSLPRDEKAKCVNAYVIKAGGK